MGMRNTGATNPDQGADERGTETDEDWLVLAAEGASKDAGGVPVALLGDYLPMLAEAATNGEFPGRTQIEAVRREGRRAAEQ